MVSDALKRKVDAGFERRDDKFLHQVFERYWNDAAPVVPKKMLKHALEDAHVLFNCQASCNEYLATVDTCGDDSVDFEGFKRAVRFPGPIEQWAKTLPLPQLLSSAMIVEEGMESLRKISQYSDGDIERTCSAFSYGLKKLLRDNVALMKKSFSVLDNHETQDSATKFETFTMSCGNLQDFQKGVSGRVGPPHIAFFSAMKAEHLTKAGCTTPFTTTNYKITTTPQQEWKFVVDMDAFGADMRHKRRIVNVDDALLSDTARSAKLTREELIAVILYTGPMFAVYNCILRQWPADRFELFNRGCNLYPTTVHVLVSAVQKIACVMRLPEGLMLYRGLGGTLRLPDGFHRPDENGCRGFAEWGFMSTTARKEVALAYSGVEQHKPLPMVLEILVGAVDRGASIAEFSQYPAEVEYLWVPCSFLEPIGAPRLEVTPSGVVTVLPVRANSNLKSLSVEDLLAQKKNLHISSFQYLLDELREQLTATAHERGAEARLRRDPFYSSNLSVADLVECIWQACADVLERHRQVPEERYTDNMVFRALVLEMADVHRMAVSKMSLWLEDPSCLFFYALREPLRESHRAYLAFLERRLPQQEPELRVEAVQTLCRAKGLFEVSVEERNELGESALFCAAVEGRGARDLQLLVEARARIDACDDAGETCLMKAAKAGQDEALRALVRLGADVAATVPLGLANGGWSAAGLAAWAGHLGCLRALHELGASVDTADCNGWSLLMAAAECGHVDCVRYLCEHGAALDCFYDRGGNHTEGLTAAMKAANSGHTDVLVILRGFGADLTRVDSNGLNALHLAADNGHDATVAALLQWLKDVDPGTKDGRTPLHMAASEGHTSTMALLAEAGAQVDRVTMESHTALMLAASKGHCDAAAWLLDRGVELDARNCEGLSALMHAAAGGHARAVAMLAKRGASASVVAQDGRTALMLAAASGDMECVELLARVSALDAADAVGRTALWHAAAGGQEAALLSLLRLGADHNAIAGDGSDALWVSSDGGHAAVVKILLDQGVDSLSRAGPGGLTPFIAAARRGHVAVINLLEMTTGQNLAKQSTLAPAATDEKAAGRMSQEGQSRRGEAEDSTAAMGYTALHWAAREGHEEAVRRLCELQADVDARCVAGLTPLMLAAAGGHTETARALAALGADPSATTHDGSTAASLARVGGHEEALAWLEGRGCWEQGAKRVDWLVVGAKVQAQFRQDSRHYPATVVEVRVAGKVGEGVEFLINWDDMDPRDRVKRAEELRVWGPPSDGAAAWRPDWQQAGQGDSDPTDRVKRARVGA